MTSSVIPFCLNLYQLCTLVVGKKIMPSVTLLLTYVPCWQKLKPVVCSSKTIFLGHNNFPISLKILLSFQWKCWHLFNEYPGMLWIVLCPRDSNNHSSELQAGRADLTQTQWMETVSGFATQFKLTTAIDSSVWMK